MIGRVVAFFLLSQPGLDHGIVEEEEVDVVEARFPDELLELVGGGSGPDFVEEAVEVVDADQAFVGFVEVLENPVQIIAANRRHETKN